MAHMDRSKTGLVSGAIAEALRAVGRATMPVLYDLPGGKVRTGPAPEAGSVALQAGQAFVLFYGGKLVSSTADQASIDYPDLAPHIKIGDRVRIYQGEIELLVTAMSAGRIETRVLRGGNLRGHATVDFPARELPFPRMREEDRQKLRIAVENGALYIGVSMVQRPDQMDAMREELLRLGAPHAKLVAKIETLSALENLDAIVERSDMVMIAGGDLSAAVGDQEALLAAEGKIAEAAVRHGKPLIAATIYEGPDAPRKVRRAASFGADYIMLESTAMASDPVGLVSGFQAVLGESGARF